MTARVRPEAIHEALLDDGALAALPMWMARAAGARSAMIQWRHPDGVHEVMACSRHAPASDALYAWKYAPIDPWVKAALATQRRGEWLRMDEHVPLRAFQKSRFCREFIHGEGDDMAHAAVAVFDSEWGEGVLCLYRGREEPAFSAQDLAPLRERLQHLGCVVRARGELVAGRRREQVLHDALDDMDLGAIVVHQDSRMVRVNLAADRVLRRADGFQTRAGILSCADPTSRTSLQAALALATAQNTPVATAIPVERVPAGSDMARNGAAGPAYMVSVTPLPSEGDGALAMLVFCDPGAPKESLLRRLRKLLAVGRPPADRPLGSRGILAATGQSIQT